MNKTYLFVVELELSCCLGDSFVFPIGAQHTSRSSPAQNYSQPEAWVYHVPFTHFFDNISLGTQISYLWRLLMLTLIFAPWSKTNLLSCTPKLLCWTLIYKKCCQTTLLICSFFQVTALCLVLLKRKPLWLQCKRFGWHLAISLRSAGAWRNKLLYFWSLWR